jgi:small-conductance mechanosensitive channel/CRP-like cAMP-binding protein
MGDLKQAVAGTELFAFGGVGLAAAVVLWIVLRAVLPKDARRRLRAPLVAIVLYALTSVASAWLPAESKVRTYVSVLSLLLLLLALGRLMTVLLVDWLLSRRLARGTPKIIRDIIEGLVVMAALLATLSAAGVDATSLLTTSALLTAIIGLSLQDTLGNLFAGLSLQAEQPFGVGDWIRYDQEAEHVGRVLEINWRATKLLTLDNVVVVIPNGQLARASILNYTKPTGVSRRSIYVTVPHEHPPTSIKSTILAAMSDLPGVLREPSPSLVTAEFQERGVRYWLRYYIDDFSRRESIDADARDRIWYGLHRAGIPLAKPIHHVRMREVGEETDAAAAQRDHAARARALRNLSFLRDLPDEAIEAAARGSRRQLYEPGEVVVRQGEPGSELYICLTGELSVRIAPHGATSVEIARLGPGGMFGELSLMTGERRSATVRAISECELLVVGKEAVSQILEASPELAELISKRLAEREAAMADAEANARPKDRAELEAQQGQLLGRIKRFFSL